MTTHATQPAHEDVIDGDFTDLARVDSGGLPSIGNSIELMSPAQLREQIERHKGLMSVLKEFVESEMVENHDYYYMSRISNPDAPIKLGEKAALMQDGAFKFLNLFKYIPGIVRKNVLRTEDGHYTVEAEAPIYNANGQLVATGDGSCSTRESKYAYRKGERTCPACEQATIRKDNKGEGGWYCWAKIGGCGAKFARGDQAIEGQNVSRMANPDIADVENTVLKMAIKRATVAAVRKLPLVSELFVPGDDPKQDNSRKDAKTQRQEEPPKGGTPNASDDPAETTAVLGEINNLLLVKCGDGETIDLDEAKKFLKGRDPSVMPLAALSKLRDELAAM
jgi:hypothetical protein